MKKLVYVIETGCKLNIHAYVPAKFPGVVHCDCMLPHSLFKEKTKSTLNHNLENYQIKQNLIIDL